MRWPLVLVLLAGCDKLFDLSHVDDHPRADAPADTRTNDVPDVDAPVDAVVQTHSSCPTFFTQPYENSQYRYFSSPLTWRQAFDFCRQLDDPTSTKRVHLSVMTGDLERQHLYVDVVGSASAFWAGLTDTKTEGTFLWVTDEVVNYPSSSAWGPNEPSNGVGDNCVRVNYSNTDLDAMACSTMTPFVCECDDYKLDAAHYTLPPL